MNQEELIAQIVEKSAAAVEARLAAKEVATEPVKQPENPDQGYFFQIQRRWWFPRTYHVTHHMFAYNDWLQNPGTGEFVLAPSMPAVILTLVNGHRLVIPEPKAKQYRIFR